MDLERLTLAHRIATPEQRLALETTISSLVNMIMQSYENGKVVLTNDSRLTTQTYVKNEDQKNLKNQYIIRKEIRLTQIENSRNYFDQEGYVYSLDNPHKHLYFLCKYSKRHKCWARVIVEDGNFNNAYLTKKHGHLPYKTELCKSKLDKKMSIICYENKFLTNREAYSKARENLDKSDVQYAPDKKSYKSFVQRIKKKYEPKIPHSVEEFHEFINDDKYKERYSFDSENQPFYRGNYRNSNGDSMILFVSEIGIKTLEKQTYIELMMDGTFKILPRHIKFSQLYVVSFVHEDRSYPFVFAFMEKRDTESYDLLFMKLKSLLNLDITHKVIKCMTDYEKAIRNVLRQHFPNARISGCWFHYIRAINKSLRKFGLTKDEKFAKAIQEVCHLPLLPNNFISEGFDYINSKIANSDRWTRFSTYWNNQWLNANISVYGLKHRTDNFSESFNKSLNLLSGRPHQDIWAVLRTIKTIETGIADDLLQHKGGKTFKTNNNELNTQILEATLIFERILDVGRFIRNVSYRHESVITLETDDEDDPDEGFCDDIKPNSFNKACNFVRNDDKHLYPDFFKRNDTILKRKATNMSTSVRKINKLFV